MIPRTLKDLYFKMMRLPMWCSGAVYRRFRAPRSGTVRVHLGPGRDRYLDGWINVDANLFGARPDVWADLRNRLPFPDASVDVFYSHHVVEHLPEAALPFHFAEMHRCLKPGGMIRIAGPDAEAAMLKYFENDRAWFGDWPVARRSIGGRFANFILCRGEHLCILTASFLEELMEDAGFVGARACQPATETTRPDVVGTEVLAAESLEPGADAPFTVVVEAHRSPAKAHGSPAEAHRSPAEAHRSPAEAHRAPAEAHRAPVEAHRPPAEARRAPVEASPGGHRGETPNARPMELPRRAGVEEAGTRGGVTQPAGATEGPAS